MTVIELHIHLIYVNVFIIDNLVAWRRNYCVVIQAKRKTPKWNKLRCRVRHRNRLMDRVN